ncbi:hypothetical protein AMJ85_01870 [candidate division BRC1 bacterium SM23_51]|nr:MAG: hypothetical protein AMJ85_01870 [candidate division BRC1 bacterium SM23_51]
MVRRWLSIIAFGAGAWVGHRYSLDLIGYYELGDDYWSDQGAIFLRTFLTLALGGLSALVVYFVISLFSRAQ